MLLSSLHKSNPLSSGGLVFAGSLAGISGNSNATGSNARFNAPSRIVADSTGNFYVSDTSNHLIRKVTQFGVVTTVFGTGSSGSTLTTLNSPRALALDASNNLYISDFSNNRILSISNGHTLGSNATLIISSIYDIEEFAVNSNGTQIVLKTNSTFGPNLLQYRNGTVDGIINTSQNNGVFNVASIACSSAGEFYYSTTLGQALNYQISAFKMYLNPPTTYVVSVTGITQAAAMYPATAAIGIDPVAAGFAVGQSFTLSGFSDESVNGYIGTITALNQSGSSNIQFKYTGSLEAYRVGVPNREAVLIYESTDVDGGNSRVLGLAWDTIPAVGGGSEGTDSPGSVLRMNYFLGDSEFDFPDIAVSPGSATTVYVDVLAKGFTGDFAIYSSPSLRDIASGTAAVYDYQYNVNVVIIGNLTGVTGPSFVHTISYGGSPPAGFTPLNGFILGPTVETGTVVTEYDASRDPIKITTNKAFSIVPSEIVNFDLQPIGDPNNTNEFSYSGSSGIVIGMKLIGEGAGSARIIEVIPKVDDPTIGIIKTSINVIVPVDADPYAGSPKYSFAPWFGGSRRILVVTFPAITFPSGIGAGTLTTTVINNNPTPLLTDGVYYGTFLKNMQFSRIDSSLLYAYLQGPDGIRQYTIREDTLTITDENNDVPNVNPFAVFPSTSEIIAVVPQPTTNNLQIYQNEY